MADAASLWKRIQTEARRCAGLNPVDLLGADPTRPQRYGAGLDRVWLDISRQLIDDAGLAALLDLARAVDLPGRIDALFSGQPVNTSEHRPALHSLMRARDTDPPVVVGGVDLSAQAQGLRTRMQALVGAYEQGRLRGARGDVLVDVVNLGVGGSDLGAVMATEALRPWRSGGGRFRFVSGMDGVQLADVLEEVHPDRTLFILSSKSFRTPDTMGNAAVLRDWLLQQVGPAALSSQVVGVSGNRAAMAAWGVAEALQLDVPDWIGGRYSISSAVGLPLALAVGWERFREFLDGMRSVDVHVRSAPLRSNLPVLMGLLAVWQRNGIGCHAHAVLPYDHRLARFPAYLQQLDMESNGKSVQQDGRPVERPTAPVLFGDFGGNSQHSFLQALHQGCEPVSVDFILPLQGSGGHPEQHALTLANGLAQAQVLMTGRSEAELREELQGLGPQQRQRMLAHRRQPGRQSSNTVLIPQVDPWHLGVLVALYEHRTFVQASMWNINPFDQWGVELGKQVAGTLVDAVAGRAPPPSAADATTRALLARICSGQSGGPEAD